MSFFSTLWGSGEKEVKPNTTPTQQQAAALAAAKLKEGTPQQPPTQQAAAPEPKPMVMPQIPTYGEAKPSNKNNNIPPPQPTQQQSSTTSGATVPGDNTNMGAPTKPMFKNLAFKPKAPTTTATATTPSATSVSPTPHVNSHSAIQQSTTQPSQPPTPTATVTPTPAKKPASNTTGGGGGLMALMKKTPAVAKTPSTQVQPTAPPRSSQTPGDDADMNSFLDGSDDDGKKINHQSTPAALDEQEEEQSGFDFMSNDDDDDNDNNGDADKDITTPTLPTQQQPQPPKQTKGLTGFAALTRKGAGAKSQPPTQPITEPPTRLQTQPIVTQELCEGNDGAVVDDDNDDNNDLLSNSSSPLVYKAKSISNYDKMFYSTTQEITIHLPIYYDLYASLQLYQGQYMNILTQLASNTTQLQINQQKMEVALENDQFEEAGRLDAQIERLQAQDTNLNLEIKAKNELIFSQQQLLEKMLKTTTDDFNTFKNVLESEVDNSITQANNKKVDLVDITLDSTTILPLTYIHEEYQRANNANLALINQHQQHMTALKTTLSNEKTGLVNENEETKGSLVHMDTNIQNFTADAKKTKMAMLEEHDQITTNIVSLEVTIADLEAQLAAKRNELSDKQTSLGELESKLISYDETSQKEQVDLQEEFSQLQEYQLDLEKRIEVYSADLTKIDQFITVQCPKNKDIIQSQTEQHLFVLQTFINGYNQRQEALQNTVLFEPFDKNLFSHKNSITTLLSSLQANWNELEEQRGELLAVQSAETTCLKEIADIDQILPLLLAEKKQAITMKAFDKAGAITTQHNVCMSNKVQKEELLVTLRQQQDDLNVKIECFETKRKDLSTSLIEQIKLSAGSVSDEDNPGNESNGNKIIISQQIKATILALIKASKVDLTYLKKYLTGMRSKFDKELIIAADNITNNDLNTTIQPQLFMSQLDCASAQGLAFHQDYLNQLINELKINKVWLFNYSPITFQSLTLLLEVEAGELMRLANLAGCDIKSLAMTDPFQPIPLKLPQPTLAPLVAFDASNVVLEDENIDDVEDENNAEDEVAVVDHDDDDHVEADQASEQPPEQIESPQEEQEEEEEQEHIAEEEEEEKEEHIAEEESGFGFMSLEGDTIIDIEEKDGQVLEQDGVENEIKAVNIDTIDQESTPVDGEDLLKIQPEEVEEQEKEHQSGFDFMGGDDDDDDDDHGEKLSDQVHNQEQDRDITTETNPVHEVQEESGFDFLGVNTVVEDQDQNSIIEQTDDPLNQQALDHSEEVQDNSAGFDFMNTNDDDNNNNIGTNNDPGHQEPQATPIPDDDDDDDDDDGDKTSTGFDFMNGGDDNAAEEVQNAPDGEEKPEEEAPSGFDFMSNNDDDNNQPLEDTPVQQEDGSNNKNTSNNSDQDDDSAAFDFLGSDYTTNDGQNHDDDDTSAFDFM